jgi:hypothetical protein
MLRRHQQTLLSIALFRRLVAPVSKPLTTTLNTNLSARFVNSFSSMLLIISPTKSLDESPLPTTTKLTPAAVSEAIS